MNPNVTAPEPQVAAQPPIEPSVQTPPVEPSPRQQIYDNYAALYNQPAAPPSPEPVAPVVEAPAPVAQPSFDATALQETISRLQAEVESLKPKPVAPTVEPPAKAVMEQWVEMLAQGKYNEAEELLFKHFTPRIQAQIQPQLVQQATEASNAERQIQSFINKFEKDNADILSMKDYVVVGAERRLQIAQNEGKIKSTADFVREYEAAVTNEANELRSKLQIARGAGKDDALTSRREVLSATTLEPTGIQMPRDNKQPAPMTTADYISMRQNKVRVLNGM